jgi:general secretion pathway protein I
MTDSVTPPRRLCGFTLVEVLVALAIIAIALLSALRVAGQGTQNVGELRARLFAGWIAQNRLDEHRALGEWLPPGLQQGYAIQGGINFGWREEVTTTPSPLFRRVDIFVYMPDEPSNALAKLTGFIVQAPGSTR